MLKALNSNPALTLLVHSGLVRLLLSPTGLRVSSGLSCGELHQVVTCYSCILYTLGHSPYARTTTPRTSSPSLYLKTQSLCSHLVLLPVLGRSPVLAPRPLGLSHACKSTGTASKSVVTTRPPLQRDCLLYRELRPRDTGRNKMTILPGEWKGTASRAHPNPRRDSQDRPHGSGLAERHPTALGLRT
jgi:hypothetical protein